MHLRNSSTTSPSNFCSCCLLAAATWLAAFCNPVQLALQLKLTMHEILRRSDWGSSATSLYFIFAEPPRTRPCTLENSWYHQVEIDGFDCHEFDVEKRIKQQELYWIVPIPYILGIFGSLNHRFFIPWFFVYVFSNTYIFTNAWTARAATFRKNSSSSNCRDRENLGADCPPRLVREAIFDFMWTIFSRGAP